MRFLASLFLSTLFLVPFYTSHAQWGDSLTITTDPENPRPGEQMTLSINSSSSSMDGATISWFVNDKKIQEGTDLKQINIKAPDVGKVLNIRVDTVSFDGSAHTQSTVIGGANVSLLWESRTYTPPFFAGISRHTNGATIVFQAIPNFKDLNGNQISSSNLIYTWKNEDSVIKGSSGKGRDSYVFDDTGVDSSTKISVFVSSPDQQFSSSASITTSRSIPEISFYKYSLLSGTDFSLQSNSFSGQKEVGVRAVPLYFPVDPLNRFIAPLMQWKLSGKIVDTKGFSYLIIQNTGSNSAIGNLSVSIKNPNYFGEDLPKNANIKFQ